MSSIQELREKRTAKAREYRNILDSHTGAIPEEAGKQLDTLEVEISALDDAIARHEKALAMEADRLTREPCGERENTRLHSAPGSLRHHHRGVEGVRRDAFRGHRDQHGHRRAHDHAHQRRHE